MLDTTQLPNRFPRSLFNYKLANKILRRVMQGEPLRKVCEGKRFPQYKTVMIWLAKGRIDPKDVNDSNKHFYQFRQAYLQAKEAQAEDIYEEIREVEERIASGELTPQQGNVLLSSLRWRIQHMDFPRYGDKKRVEGTTRVTHNVVIEREVIEEVKTVSPLMLEDSSDNEQET